MAYTAIAGLVVAIIGAAVSAASAVSQGQTAKAAADYNADAQRKTAISIENKGAEDAQAQKLKAQRLEATQVATAGASGVDPLTGSPLDVEQNTREFGELDSLRIINNAQGSAWGYNTEADITGNQGTQAQRGSYLTAGSSLLGGASSAYFGYSKVGGGVNASNYGV